MVSKSQHTVRRDPRLDFLANKKNDFYFSYDGYVESPSCAYFIEQYLSGDSDDTARLGLEARSVSSAHYIERSMPTESCELCARQAGDE